uniref:PDZ domain-containing protein n=1 Tax=Timema shepardi TaxID=629360 RepID=A0A7R9B005_TIMSH|nr:unnamed protein product [Timema shepardi]
MSNGLTTDAPVARLCHIIQLEDFDGYGFNLHAEKGKPGQFIGKVDEGSPAEAAGLKLGDRIIEVNGVNIANDNHKQVVQRIKSKQNETELLVVDSEADTYFKSNNITIHSGLPDILHLTTPITASTKIDSNEDKRGENSEDAQSQKSVKSVASADHEVLAMDNSAATTPSSERKHSPAYSPANSPEPQADSADEVEPHIFLNVCKGVVTYYDLDCVSIEDICDELAPQHVAELILLRHLHGLCHSSLLKTPPSPPRGPKLCAAIVDPLYPAFGTPEFGMSGGTGEATKASPTGALRKDQRATTEKYRHLKMQETHFRPTDNPMLHGYDVYRTDKPFFDRTLPSMETSHSNIDDVSIEQNHHNASLNLNMTAKELRAQLASRKKYDPKKESMDFKKKYDIVQKL